MEILPRRTFLGGMMFASAHKLMDILFDSNDKLLYDFKVDYEYKNVVFTPTIMVKQGDSWIIEKKGYLVKKDEIKPIDDVKTNISKPVVIKRTIKVPNPKRQELLHQIAELSEQLKQLQEGIVGLDTLINNLQQQRQYLLESAKELDATKGFEILDQFDIRDNTITSNAELLSKVAEPFRAKLTREFAANNNDKKSYTLRNFLDLLRQGGLADNRYMTGSLSNLLEDLLRVYADDITVRVSLTSKDSHAPADYSHGNRTITLYIPDLVNETHMYEMLIHELVHHRYQTDAQGAYSATKVYLIELAETLSSELGLEPDSILN